ncbi:probable NADH-dependent dyhydrogenase [Roseobacter sp. MED193]|uniref:Gfo/Idh/MocA family protein n=1 Tax=Roseobacter sp. MED193 TaxID=314262 RepID=UPI000068A1FE|nr:Gfo/Idh/MocA family oxidoreductase [Roseobacter sp. MED193]EAQ45342.1 probable NADH-dependent dyhydrogenase [Roseobacter sp. MED193]
MTSASPIKVACVGAGYFSQFHYASWARMENVTLVGSCNRGIEKARATGLAAYDDLAQMLVETAPDLLDIILPPVAHAACIRMALAAGVKTMICQKPFCRDLSEAREMVSLAKAQGARIIVHENFRFQPWYRAMKQALMRSDIGTVQQLTFRLRPGDGQGPKAYLARQPYFQTMERFLVHETAVHWIDTFRYLLGDPIAIYADLRQVNPVIAGEDAGYILSEHPGGVRALFDGNRSLDHAAENHRRTMGEALLEGTEGSITLTGDGALHLRRFGAQNQICLLAPDTWDGFGGDCVHHLQSHVISGLLGAGDFENEAASYLRVIEIEEAVYHSAQTGRKISLETE